MSADPEEVDESVVVSEESEVDPVSFVVSPEEESVVLLEDGSVDVPLDVSEDVEVYEESVFEPLDDVSCPPVVDESVELEVYPLPVVVVESAEFVDPEVESVVDVFESVDMVVGVVSGYVYSSFSDHHVLNLNLPI